MSAYKYYSALKGTDGTQILPSDLRLHNDNAVAITLEITPTTPNSIYGPLATDKIITSSLVGVTTGRFNASGNISETTDIVEGNGLAKISIVAALGDITTTTIVDEGNDFRAGMSVSTIVDDVNTTGINKGVATMTQGATPIESAYFIYSPLSSGVGTGFRVGFSISALLAIQDVSILNEGTGYADGDALLFSENGQTFTLTVATADLGTNVTLYFDLVASDLENDTFPLILNIGDTTDFLVKAVKVEGANDRSLLAYLV